MKNIVFRNYDSYAIKHLLKEIGEHRMRTECEGRKQGFPKRLSLFYIEANDDCTFLKYSYPQRGESVIMKVDRYEMPQHGWVRAVLR